MRIRHVAVLFLVTLLGLALLYRGVPSRFLLVLSFDFCAYGQGIEPSAGGTLTGRAGLRFAYDRSSANTADARAGVPIEASEPQALDTCGR